MLQVTNVLNAQETEQKILGQLSDLYDRELVGIIGKYRPRSTRHVFVLILPNFPYSTDAQFFVPSQVGLNKSQDLAS